MPKADLLNSVSRHGSAPTKLKPKAAWRGAGQLRPGDRVITKDGRIGIVKATNTVPTLSTVHNFAVEDHHTYFVGDGPGVWVHNQYSGAAEEEMTQEEADNLMGPLEAKDAHLRPAEETNLRDSLSPAAQIVFDKHGEEGLRRVSNTLAAVTDDNPLVTEDLKGSRQNRLLEVAGYSDDEIRILRRGDDTFARAVIASDPIFKNVINFDTLGRLDVDGIREVLPLIDSIKASGPVDIFIGGAGDGSSNLVSNYETRFENANSGRSTFYFQQGNRRKVIALATQVSNDRELNIIGHSWGGFDAAIIATNMADIAPERIITRLIGVDPVNKPGGGIFGDSPKSLSNVSQIVHVDATGSEKRIDDGNFIRGLGRGVGGGRPDIFKNENAIFIEAPYAHFNFNGLMNHTPIGGQSARDLLLGLPAPTPAPTK